MKCPQCNAQLEDDTVFCGNCGTQIVPLQAKGATVAYKAGEGEDNFATVISTSQSSQPPTPQTPIRNNALQPATPYRGDTPTFLSSPPPPGRKNNTWRIAFVVVMVLLIIGVGTLGTIALLKNHTSATNNSSANTPLATNANGTVSFSDSQNGSGHSNVVTVSVRGLTAPPTGSQYTAWIVDTQSERATGLGTLTQNKDGTYTAKSTDVHHNVLSLGNRVVVTLEQGTVTVPTGQVILSSAFPPKAFVHIKHLLVSFPDTPGKIGLLVGLIDQAQKLSSASQLLQSISASQNGIAIQCAAQSIIDIAEGTPGSHYKLLANQCASENIAEIGDGYGLLRILLLGANRIAVDVDRFAFVDDIRAVVVVAGAIRAARDHAIGGHQVAAARVGDDGADSEPGDEAGGHGPGPLRCSFRPDWPAEGCAT